MTSHNRNLPNANTIFRKTAAQGATILTWQNSASPAVVVKGLLFPGAISDPVGKQGLASFTRSMLMTGTKNLEFQDLHDKIESLGASIHLQAGRLMTQFSLQCLAEDLLTILNLLTEILSSPSFPEKHFNRIKTQIQTAIAIRAQDTATMADQAFDRAFYGSHPFAHPTIGYAQEVANITLDDVRAFHAERFTPRGMMIAAAGGLAPDALATMIEKSLGQWDKTAEKFQPELPDFIAPDQARREHVRMDEKSQTDLVLGVLGPETMGTDYHACSLGNNILGQFGMMGRIGESVREKAGLAYYVQSELGSGIGPTPWQVVAGVNPDNLAKAIKLIKEEITRFISEPVTSQELEDCRAQAIGRLPLALESNSGIASSLLSMERYQLGLDHLQELPSLLASISAQDILDAAQRYWKMDKLILTSAGKAIE